MLQPLNKVRALQDPLRQLQCDFTITDTPGYLLSRIQQKVIGKLSGNEQTVTSSTLNLRCTSFSYPGSKIKQSETIIFGFKRKIGTIQDKSGIWKCTAVEDQEGGVLNVIQGWCDLIHNNLSGIRLPYQAYVGTAEVVIHGLKGERKLWLHGFYPVEYKVSEIDASGSKPVTVDISFNYDYFTENSYAIAPMVNDKVVSTLGRIFNL